MIDLMIPEALHQYVVKAREKGLDDGIIKQHLISAGWNEELVHFALTNNDDLIVPVPSASDTVTHVETAGTMWDTFQNILLFISLYVFATSFVLILHQFINHYFPPINALRYSMGPLNVNYVLRGQVAALLVSYPLFAYFFLANIKRTKKKPEIRLQKSRKQFIYITLIVTFVIVLINIISIVYNFLGGNITLNFFLQFITTVTVSSIIFGYYLLQVKEDRKQYA